MPLSTFQKVTLVSCLVLCVSLLLPKMLLSRGKKEVGTPDAGSSQFPPMIDRQKISEGRLPSSPFPKSHSSDAMFKTKGIIGGKGGSKTSFMGQIIPIYIFGIVLYILYILFKITSKSQTSKNDKRFPFIKPENAKRKITDFELSQLQEKLKDTEEVMERIVSKVGENPDKIKSVASEHEAKLLQHLNEITQAMQDVNLIDGPSPEKEAEELSYSEDWDGYPEETYPVYDEPPCCRERCDTISVDGNDASQPSAEELAEQIEEEDLLGHTNFDLEVNLQETFDNSREVKTFEKEGSFCERRGVFLYENSSHACSDKEEDDEDGSSMDCQSDDDPAVLAENISFSFDSHSDDENQWLNEFDPVDTTRQNSKDLKMPGEPKLRSIRKRNTNLEK
ncbi:protein RIC-3-like [Polypterus senegalus]